MSVYSPIDSRKMHKRMPLSVAVRAVNRWKQRGGKCPDQASIGFRFSWPLFNHSWLLRICQHTLKLPSWRNVTKTTAVWATGIQAPP